MPVLKLSQGLLETLNSSGKDKEDFFDSTTKGLMVQVRASGRKTYYFRERGEDGKTIQLKIADADAIRLNKAQALRASGASRKACPRELEMIARAEALRAGIAF